MAADKGHAQAQYYLGLMYCEGNGVPQDPVQAYLWLSLAAEKGIEAAGVYLDVLAEHMTPDQISQAREIAKSWEQRNQKQSVDNSKNDNY
jgi:hypothetical protein